VGLCVCVVWCVLVCVCLCLLVIENALLIVAYVAEEHVKWVQLLTQAPP